MSDSSTGSNFTYHFDPHPEHYCILNTSDDAFLLDARLSPTTIYVMTVIRTLQSGKWEFSVEGLAKYTQRSKDLISHALKQLKECGYYLTECVRKNGRFGGVQHTFYDIPADVSDQPYPENPDTVKPAPVNPCPEKPCPEIPAQPNNKNTFYQTKPKKEKPKVPPRESSLDFDLEDIIEKPPVKPEENRSG